MGLDVCIEVTVGGWVCWFTTGDRHLEPQVGEKGEVVGEVWEGLKGVEEMPEGWVL